MGHKVNPVGLRLGINRTWDSRWFAAGDYAKLLHEDLKLRGHLREKLRSAGVSRVVIERPAKKARITLHTARGNDVYSQIDGEEWQAGRRFRVTVHHRVLPLIVPNDFVPPWSLGG